MTTRRHKYLKRNKTYKSHGGKSKTEKSKTGKSKTGKKWVTAIDAATHTLEKTGSISAAKKSLKKQALYNARKLFGSV
jgi:hypothetical protein